MPILEEIAGAGIGTGLGLITGAINQNQNRKAQERAFGMQKELNQQGKDLALQQWKDTNYNAQRRELEKAGLNAGLLYGGNGGGGVTANTGSGGSAPSQAPTNYEIGGMGIQGAQAIANIKLTEAQTENVNADTENKTGVERENKTADTGIKTTQNKIMEQTLRSVVDKAFYDAVSSQHDSSIKGSEAGLKADAWGDNRKIIENQAILSSLEIGAKEIGIKLTEAQIKNMAEQIAIGKFNANINAEQMGLDKVAGTQLNNLIDEIYKKTGKTEMKTKQIK